VREGWVYVAERDGYCRVLQRDSTGEPRAADIQAGEAANADNGVVCYLWGEEGCGYWARRRGTRLLGGKRGGVRNSGVFGDMCQVSKGIMHKLRRLHWRECDMMSSAIGGSSISLLYSIVNSLIPLHIHLSASLSLRILALHPLLVHPLLRLSFFLLCHVLDALCFRGPRIL